MTVALSSDDHDRIARAARILASPLAFDTTAEWGLAAQQAAAEAVGADKSFIHWTGLDELITETYSPDAIAQYASYLPLFEEIGLYERSERLGVFTRREAYGPHVERMRETEYVQEFLPSVDANDALTIYVPAGRRPASEPAVQLIVNSSTPGKSFGPRHTEIACRLRPAFEAGVAVQRQMNGVRGDLMSLVDVSGGACAVFAADGCLVHVSRALEAALTREPSRAALVDLAQRMAVEAMASPQKAMKGHFVGAAGRYHFSASAALESRPLVVVAVDVPPRPRQGPTSDEVAERFGLTPRQAEVALLLGQRYSNKEIAAALSVSVHTARHHVEAVLDRLGVHRKDIGKAIWRRDARVPE